MMVFIHGGVPGITPYASGPHICLGMHLTRLETLTAVEAVLRLPGLDLAPDSPAPRGLVFRKPSALRVTWDG